MHFGEAIGLLAVLTVAAIILRSFWTRIPRRVEKILLVGASFAVAIRFVFLVTSWSTVSPFLNSLLAWFAVAGYELMLIRFSLMRPRWLTSMSALILLMPIFGSTLLFPLTGIFDFRPDDIRQLAKNYSVERNPWDVAMNGKEGYDFGVFYQPSFAPFLRHIVQRSSFSDEQCDSKAVTVSADPTKKLVHFHCPGHHGSLDAIDLLLPLK